MRMRNESPLVPAVIVSAEEEKSVVLQAITYGAIGFITKSSPRTQMAQALQQILGGNVYLPTDVIHGTASSAKATTSRPATRDESISPEMLESLTRRQLKVLERMAMGESNKQIAYNLSIAETTVKAHVSAILRKLNVHNRIQAVLNAGNIDFSEYLKR
jgi:DNA-binding NarL/FixJ family response regulator